MTAATIVTTESWAILEPWPELDTAIVRWRLDAEFDAYLDRERAIDGMLFAALDRGVQPDLDTIIDPITT